MTGAELKAARVALGWSAPLAAAVVGYSAAAVYALEADRGGGSRMQDALAWAYSKGNDPDRWSSMAPSELKTFWERRTRRRK